MDLQGVIDFLSEPTVKHGGFLYFSFLSFELLKIKIHPQRRKMTSADIIKNFPAQTTANF
jgi:hypothetical protein